MLNNHDTTHPSGYCPECQVVTLQTTQRHAAGGIKWTCCRCGRWDYQREEPATPGEG